MPLVQPVTPDAFKATQTEAIQDRLSSQGRRPREDRRASSHPRYSVNREAQGKTAQAQAHAGQAAARQPVDRNRSAERLQSDSFSNLKVHFSALLLANIPASEPNGYFSFPGAEILLVMRAKAR